MSVLIKSLFLIFLCVYSIRCQGLLNMMFKDPNITEFVKIINGSKTLSDYFNNNFLVVFVPSNAAINSITLANYESSKIAKSHMYTSNIPATGSFQGTTSNWPKYETISSKSMTYYRMTSMDDLNVLFMYMIGSTYRVNDAVLTSWDNVNGTQVYHVIDKVFVNYQDIKFLAYLQSNQDLKKSFRMWSALRDGANKGRLPSSSTFQASFIDFSPKIFATVLVPTNTAWDGVVDVDALTKDLELNSNANYSLINSIMFKFYIPMNLLFLNSTSVNFSAGFGDLQTNANLLPGLITSDLQVKVNTSSGRVVNANIPLDYGVIHIIDNALYIPVTISAYLEQYSKIYIDTLKKYPSVGVYLNETNTFMPIDDITMAGIVKSPNITKILLNTIIPGNIIFNETNPPIKTMGGLLIKLILINSKYYLAAYQSQSDNTWISIAPTSKLNQIVGSTFVTLINGVLTDTPDTCDSTLQKLNCSLYQTLIIPTANNVTLNIGSPYTMFVPNDFSLYPFMANFRTANLPIIKYIIQRMIIANRMILATRPPGSFQAATMNYAAMLENLNMTIVGSILNIRFNEFNQSYDFSGGGIYCYSNSLDDSIRYNLIYPVSFVISSISDNSTKICVTPPCIACHTTYNYLLLIIVSLLAIRHHITTANI